MGYGPEFISDLVIPVRRPPSSRAIAAYQPSPENLEEMKQFFLLCAAGHSGLDLGADPARWMVRRIGDRACIGPFEAAEG
jgi:hypothetical protein